MDHADVNVKVPGRLGHALRTIYGHRVARSRPIRVSYRLAAWQLWRRMAKRPLNFRGTTGAHFSLIPGLSDSLSAYWYHDIPDFEEMCFALHLLRPGEMMVDVGANQGGWTLTMAAAGVSVVSFEPVPETAARLAANIKNNPAAIGALIEVHAVALGDAEGTIHFTTRLDTGNHRISEGIEHMGRDADTPSIDQIDVPMTTADAALSGRTPVLIKIDVEGEELAVLNGAMRVLADSGLAAVIIETFRSHNHHREPLMTIERELSRLGFKPVEYSPVSRQIRSLTDPSDGGQNTIYLRNRDLAEARVRDARPVLVLGRHV
jgi:FkbM family methyltransferase